MRALHRSVILVAGGFCILGFILAPLLKAEVREWTSNDGRKIQAEFVRLDGSNVIVILRGKETSIALSKFSEADQNWVKSQKPAGSGDVVSLTSERPEFYIPEPEQGLIDVMISIPLGYHDPSLQAVAPDGSIFEIEHLNVNKLDGLVQLLSTMQEFVDGKSGTEAEELDDHFDRLGRSLNEKLEESGVDDLANYAYARAAGRDISASFSNKRDDRSRDEKRADMFIGPVSLGLGPDYGDSKKWRDVKSSIKACLDYLSDPNPDHRFVYRCDEIAYTADEEKKRLGVWKLVAGGAVLDEQDVKAGR